MSKSNNTLFLDACRTGNIEEMKKLGQCICNVDILFTFQKGRSTQTMTPLCAVLALRPPPQNIEEVVNELLSMGASPLFSCKERSLEWFARANGHFCIAEMLKDRVDKEIEKEMKNFYGIEEFDTMKEFEEMDGIPSVDWCSECKFDEIKNSIGFNDEDYGFSPVEEHKDKFKSSKKIRKRDCFYNFLHGVVKVN